MIISSSNLLFFSLSFFTLFFAFLVVSSKNPISSVLFLVGTFLCCAGIFLQLEINLLGLIYIIVYVGAIAILFIFVIMMMDLSNINSYPFYDKSQKSIMNKSNYSLVILILLLLLIAINLIDQNTTSYLFYQDYFSTWEIAQRKIWDSLLISIDLIHSVGYILYTDLLSLLIFISFILLMIMVGVIVLTVDYKDK